MTITRKVIPDPSSDIWRQNTSGKVTLYILKTHNVYSFIYLLILFLRSINRWRSCRWFDQSASTSIKSASTDQSASSSSRLARVYKPSELLHFRHSAFLSLKTLFTVNKSMDEFLDCILGHDEVTYSVPAEPQQQPERSAGDNGQAAKRGHSGEQVSFFVFVYYHCFIIVHFCIVSVQSPAGEEAEGSGERRSCKGRASNGRASNGRTSQTHPAPKGRSVQARQAKAWKDWTGLFVFVCCFFCML